MNTRQAVIRFHRAAAKIAWWVVLMWGVSGILHPLLSRLGPDVERLPAWAEANPEQSLIMQAKLALAGELLIQSLEPNIQEVFAFSDEYPAFMRVLPVMRVAWQDSRHTRVFIDPATGRVLTATDDYKVLGARWFRRVHTLDWPWLSKPVQLGIKVVLVGLLLSMVITGLMRWWYARVADRLRAKGKAVSAPASASGMMSESMPLAPTTRVGARVSTHRRWAVVIALPLCIYLGTGIFHMYRDFYDDAWKKTEKWTFQNLHKWQFMDGVGKIPRDVLQVSTLLLMLYVIYSAKKSSAASRSSSRH